jgi:hypothetical protein
MTQAYQEWSDTPSGARITGPLPWTMLVPPGWQGFCCYCRRRLTAADWRDGQIAAAGYGDPWHCLCVSHLQADRRERKHAILAMARAVSGV